MLSVATHMVGKREIWASGNSRFVRHGERGLRVLSVSVCF